MVLCEAMLCGVPVVTLSTPLKDNSQLEVVGHGKGGLVALTPEALPEAMVALIGDADLRAGVSVGGAAWVRERFAVGRSAGRRSRSIGGAFRPRSAGRLRTGGGSRRCWRGVWARGRTLADGAAFRLLHMPLIYRAYLSLARREAA